MLEKTKVKSIQQDKPAVMPPQNVKLFLFKLTFFTLMVLIIQILAGPVVSRFMAPRGIQWIQTLDNYLEDDVNVIFFGDSSMTYTSKHDKDKRNIADILQSMNPDLSIKRVSHAAYHLDLYWKYCEYISRQNNKPKVVIIPINLRSFSAGWDLAPNYQFEFEKALLSYGNRFLIRSFSRPLTIFNPFDEEGFREEFENALVYNGDQLLGKLEDYGNETNLSSDEKIRQSMIINYMYSLDESHRKVQSMLEIARLAKEGHFQVIFYITPIDYQTGEEYLGASFIERISQNTEIINSLLIEQEVEVLALSFGLEKTGLDWEGAPNEHLNEDGRKFLAEQLSVVLQKIIE
jgi:hypothetical protein